MFHHCSQYWEMELSFKNRPSLDLLVRDNFNKLEWWMKIPIPYEPTLTSLSKLAVMSFYFSCDFLLVYMFCLFVCLIPEVEYASPLLKFP